MHPFTRRIAKLELYDTKARILAQPWVPPSREAVAALLASVLPIYAACGLLKGPVLDETAVTVVLAEMPWPSATQEPVSLQGYHLLQDALLLCGLSMGESQ